MTEEYRKLTTLLDKTKHIIAKHEEMAHLKGENFNVFSLLDKRTDEVRTHSAMIAELLNPKGSHGMNDTFLNFFIDMVNNKLNPKNTDENQEQFIKKNNLRSTQVNVEYHIGKIKNTQGGQIDILLSNNDFVICIENKINAGDQDYQLIRYHDYVKNQYKKHGYLFYLTLEGKCASEISTQYSSQGSQPIELIPKKDYHCLSYRNDMLQWLEKCYHYSIELPVLRESIKQYINLIKSLTNQLISNKMKEEVFKAIVSDIETAESINNNFEKAINHYADKLKNEIIGKLKIKYPDAIIETKNSNSFSNIFIWFPKEEIHFGIESFNNYSLSNNGPNQKEKKHLVIGRVDWRGKDSGDNITHGIWLKDYQPKEIYTKDKLFQGLKEYSSNNDSSRSKVVDDIFGKITKYIENQLS